MSSKAMSLKGKIKNYAKNHNIAAQVVLQNYMFERFLERLSKTEYREKFVVKGGMLIAAIVGVDTRSTMDLDTTLRNLPLTKEQITEAMEAVCDIDLKDEVIFGIKSIEPIRKDDVYGGYCVRMDAVYDTIITPLSVDVSTGDIITPAAVKYEFIGIFDEDVRITLWGYNIETVLAEKTETILRRGIFSTRPRDFYDAYILETTQKYDKKVFREALRATVVHRGSVDAVSDIKGVMQQISDSDSLKKMWLKYQKKFEYAQNISYEEIMEALRRILADSE